MTREEAKFILLAYRQDTSDRDDSEIAEALAFAESDPELGRWLEEALENQAVFRQALHDIPPPDELKGQILLAHERFVSPGTSTRKWGLIAAAAVIAALIIVSAVLVKPESESRTFADYRNRIVRTVIREYRMDITTGDADAIQTFLRDGELNVELPVTPSLEQVPLIGAGQLTWKGSPVAMVCFETAEKQKLFLFAVDRNAVETPPESGGVEERISSLETVSWSADDNVYILAGEMDADALKRLL